MVELEADFSTTVRYGMILAYLDTTRENLQIGDVVMAVDHEEDLAYSGTIVEIEGQYAYLRMHWRDRNPQELRI